MGVTSVSGSSHLINMIQILYNPSNPRYIFLVPGETDKPYIRLLEKHMNRIPQYQLLPTYPGIPRPEVFLEQFRKGDKVIYYCAAGLWKEVLETLRKIPGATFDASRLDNLFKLTGFQLSLEETAQRIQSWGLNIEPRDYQIEAAWRILHYKLSLSELATRSGKTLILYMVARLAQEELGVKHWLMIVPSVHLVKQGAQDLKDYQDFFGTEQIWAGGEEVEMANLTIGTFQSLIRKADPKYPDKYDPHFFDKFDGVVVDEAHRAPCRSIRKILALEAFNKPVLRFGFTGTLPKPNTIEHLSCQALLGPKIQEIRARELIDEGFLADPIITQYRIHYEPESLRDTWVKCAEYLLSSSPKEPGMLERPLMTYRHVKKLPGMIVSARNNLDPWEYVRFLERSCAASSKTLNLEQMAAQFSYTKIELLIKLLREKATKNTILFVHNTEYLRYLASVLEKEFPDRPIYKISGSVPVKKRQKILSALQESSNNILVASFGCLSTGITLTNIDYGVFVQSFKADTITKQSIGRGLLRTSEKTCFYVYDLIDVFSTGKIRSQGAAKIKTYKEEGYQHQVIDLKDQKFIPIPEWREILYPKD